MLNISFGDRRVYTPQDAAEAVADLGVPTPLNFEKANSLYVPCGQEAACGYLFMLRSDLDSTFLDALHNLTFAFYEEITGSVQQRVFNDLVVCREPICLTPNQNASNSLYLVEVADSRWRVHNPYYQVACNKLYNVPSNGSNGTGGPSVYLTSSLRSGSITGATNATPIVITSTAHWLLTGASVVITGVGGNTAANGTWTITRIDADTFSLDTSVGNGGYTSGGTWTSPWTWTLMLADLWSLVSTQMGTYPGIPVTPDGYPFAWLFEGCSAWESICTLLKRIGCTVRPNLQAASGSQYTIVQIGAADAVSDLVLTNATAANLKIHDAEFQNVIRGRVPYGVRVFFHKCLETPTQIPPFLQNTVPYSVDVDGPDTASAEANVYHPIWDDSLAIYDDLGALTNGAALDDRAQERADDYYRMLRTTGGGRLWQRYSGFLNLSPGSTVKSVSWYGVQVPGGENDADEVFTDVVRRPPEEMVACCDGNDYANPGVVQDLVRVGFPTGGGTTGCFSYLNACTGLVEHWDVVNGIWTLRTTPCPQCGSGSGSGSCQCFAIDCYEAVFSGVTDSICDCSGFTTVEMNRIPAGTVIIAPFGIETATDCNWLATMTGCSGQQLSVLFTKELGVWAIAIYRIWGAVSTMEAEYLSSVDDSDSYDCLVPLTLTRFIPSGSGAGGTSACQTWPTTIIVQPCAGSATPTIDGGQTADLCDDAVTITFSGTNFVSPATANTVVLKDSANVTVAHGTVSGTSTELTMTLTAPPIANLGSLTAEVTNVNGDSGAVQVVTVVTCAPIWTDTFTDTNGTLLTDHTPDLSPGGAGYTASVRDFEIQSNTIRGTDMPAYVTFDPGETVTETTLDIILNSNTAGAPIILHFRALGAVSNLFVEVINIATDSYALVLSDGTNTDSTTVTLTAPATFTLTVIDTSTHVTATINGATVALSTTVDNTQTGFGIEVQSVSATDTSFDNLNISAP